MNDSSNLFDCVQEMLHHPPSGLITDIDGTISRIAPTPAQAQISPICRHYLALLSQRLGLVAFVSGRPVTQMREMLKLKNVLYIGNHGLERWEGGKVRLRSDVSQYLDVIKATLQEVNHLLNVEGLLFDNKGVTACIHYRLCQDHQAARKHILVAVANSPSAKSLRVTEGKMAIELRPLVEVNKGTVVQELVKEYQLWGGIYLGDDLGDVEAMQAIHSIPSPNFEGIAVGVTGEEGVPEVEEEADFTLKGVSEVERFLEWLGQAAAAPPAP